VIASSALPIGGWIGAWRPPPKAVTAGLLAFASGALITAVSFELFAAGFERGGAWRVGISFFAGATAFIVIDTRLENYTEQRKAAGAGVGYALLAAVTLDGVPENLALGVGLVESNNPALLVAILASNFPEAVVGAQMMRRSGMERRSILLTWGVTAILLALAVVAGYGALDGVSDQKLAWPLGFAAGAVLASLADTLMPEAYGEGGPHVAYFTAA
jgi:zinc transporter, ZIP family